MAKGTFDNNDNKNKQDKDDEFEINDFLVKICDGLADAVIQSNFSSTDLGLAALLFKLQMKGEVIMRILSKNEWADCEWEDLVEKAEALNNGIDEWLERHHYDKNGNRTIKD